MAKKSGSIIKSYCNECLQETNHDLIDSRHRNWLHTDDEGVPHAEEAMQYEFVQCRGCECVSLRRTYTSTFSEDGPEIDYFPPAVSRRTPEWMSGLRMFALGGPKNEVRQLLKEVYSAMFSGNSRLALMGARAVVDIALTDKLGDIGGFEQKLNEALEQKWITPAQHKVLKSAVDAGNAASHRAYHPEKKQLGLVLDVVEHLVQLLYVLERDGEEIAKKTPPRSGKSK